jgi:predicted MPP superfamily phosphohydrolase
MDEIDIIKKENEELKKKIVELEQRLKKYTNGNNHKKYYEKNKEKYKELGSNYLQKLKEENPAKLREYRQRAYQKRKEKMKQEQASSNSLENLATIQLNENGK